MGLNHEIKKYIDNSVLCWLATASSDGIPNVSPKEIFNYYGTESIIIANIASPQSVKNILQNNQASISFIDILVQKGYQIKGEAAIIDANNESFLDMKKCLEKLTEGKFPFKSIISVRVETIKPIIAPKYILYPETTEQDQIRSARKTYGL